jgi:hypothetical protein
VEVIWFFPSRFRLLWWYGYRGRCDCFVELSFQLGITGSDVITAMSLTGVITKRGESSFIGSFATGHLILGLFPVFIYLYGTNGTLFHLMLL